MAKKQINVSYFHGELTIAQITETSVRNDVTSFIAKYSNELVELLLGKPLYDAYVTGMTAGVPDAKWVALDNKIYDETNFWSPAANYAYWYYQRNLATQTTGTGEKLMKTENSVTVGNGPKGKLMWNDMVKQNKKIMSFIKANPVDYVEYIDPVIDNSTPETIQLYKDRKNILTYANPFF